MLAIIHQNDKGGYVLYIYVSIFFSCRRLDPGTLRRAATFVGQERERELRAKRRRGGREKKTKKRKRNKRKGREKKKEKREKNSRRGLIATSLHLFSG